MEGYGNRRARTLSGGEQQRVAVARVLVKNPSVVLADEPTGALDEENAKQVFETLKLVSADRLVVVVTHDIENAFRYADVLYTISDGRISTTKVMSAPCNFAPKSEEEASLKRKKLNPFRIERKFALRQILAAKIRSSFFILLFAMLLSVLFSCVSVIFITEADVTWTYLKQQKTPFVRLEEYGERGVQNLSGDTVSYLNEHTDCLFSTITDGKETWSIGITENLTAFLPLIAGDGSGAVVLSDGENVSIGGTVVLFDKEIAVTGIADADALPEIWREAFPNVILNSSCLSSYGIQDFEARYVTVKGSSLTKSELKFLLGERSLRVSLLDYLTDHYGNQIEAGECIRENYSELGLLRVLVSALGAVIAIVAFVYTIYFVAFLITENRRTIGILKSLGVGDRDIAFIFLLQVGLLFIFAFLLSVFGTAGALYGLNYALVYSAGIRIAFFTVRWTYLFVVLGVIIVCGFAVILPLKRIQKIRVGELLRSL